MTTTSSKKTQAEQLAEEFQPEAHKTMNKGGTNLTYIPVSEVVSRLNDVLGVTGWKITSSSVCRDSLDTDWCVGSCTIEATIDGETTVRTGWGGQKIKQLKNMGGPVDLGDEFKGAASDAFKKAASLLGVGLYLSRDEDAILAAEEAKYRILSEDEVGALATLINELDDEERGSLASWWKDERLPKRDSGYLNENHLGLIKAFIGAL